MDVRLYLNKEWAKDKKRRKKCGVPSDVRFQTRHSLALEMLAEHGRRCRTLGSRATTKWDVARHFAGICKLWEKSISWPCHRTRWCETWRQRRRSMAVVGVIPRFLLCASIVGVRRWQRTVWTTIDVRDGSRGPLVVQAAKTRVQAKTDRRRKGPEEVLVVVREEQSDGTMKHDYYLSNATFDTPLAEFARVAKAEHRIEECLERAKSDAAMAQYQVRNWMGWHHHQTLSLLATWFLTQEDMRGKKIHPGSHGPEDPRHNCSAAMSTALDCGSPSYIKRKSDRISLRNEIAYAYHWKSRNLLPPLRIKQRK